MALYDYRSIEKKWQKIWDEEKTFAAKDDHTMPKFYAQSKKLVLYLLMMHK